MNSSISTLLTLRQIASWQVPDLLQEEKPPFVAELPSLQRESVWKPAQIELVWDSIFRGFPIGSLVVSRYLEGQRFRSGSVAQNRKSPWADLPHVEKRALLDGQQRCNAIALGFLNPLPPSTDPPSILWIDLKPKLPTNSTRKFLFRVTTRSHPWGYANDDATTRLNTAQMKKLPAESYQNRHGTNRLRPFELYPFEAELPIPLAWLLKFDRSKSGSKGIWDTLRDDCENALHSLQNKAHDALPPWQKKTYDALSRLQDDEDLRACLKRIESGLALANQCSVVALQVPDDILDLEAADPVRGSDGDSSNSCIGILFKRLNNGGTSISGPDLTYSMIKTSWPGVEMRIDEVKRQMSASGLFQIGARAAVDSPEAIKLHSGFNISKLRQIACGASEENRELKKLILDYFGISADGSTSAPASPFVEGVQRVESWLLYQTGADNDIGLPPLVRSQIVQKSPHIYLLLLILAKRFSKAQESSGDIRRSILGLVTSLHWFSGDAKERSIERIFKRLQQLDTQLLDQQFFAGIWEDFADLAILGNGFLIPPTPESLKDKIPKPSMVDFETGSWDSCPLTASLRGIQSNKEFLLYAQRGYLDSEFQGFDSSDIKTSEDHNRPWDYDHLLPRSHFHNQRKWGKNRLKLCQRWGGSIGNFHILPFELNRSRGNKPLDQFLKSLPNNMSLVRYEAITSFTKLPREDDEQLIKFVGACQQRIVDIYENWYDSLDISFLLGSALNQGQEHDEPQRPTKPE